MLLKMVFASLFSSLIHSGFELTTTAASAKPLLRHTFSFSAQLHSATTALKATCLLKERNVSSVCELFIASQKVIKDS